MPACLAVPVTVTAAEGHLEPPLGRGINLQVSLTAIVPLPARFGAAK